MNLDVSITSCFYVEYMNMSGELVRIYITWNELNKVREKLQKCHIIIEQGVSPHASIRLRTNHNFIFEIFNFLSDDFDNILAWLTKLGMRKSGRGISDSFNNLKDKSN